MNKYDMKLEEIEQKKTQQTMLTDQLKAAQSQREELKGNAERLEAVHKIFQQDVERLNHGRQSDKKQAALEEAQNKERTSYAEYFPVRQELEALESRISGMEQELDRLNNIDEEYRAALQEKQTYLQRQGGEAALEILRLENEKDRLRVRQKEMNEAIETGQTVLETAESLFGSVIDFYSSAHSDAESNVFGRVYDKAFERTYNDRSVGDALMAACKIGSVVVAKKKLPKLREQLAAYTAQLSDVEIYMDDIDLNINGILAFTDVLVDNAISDILVARKGSREVEKVRRVINQIKETQVHLSEERTSIEDDMKQVQSELDKLVRCSAID